MAKGSNKLVAIVTSSRDVWIPPLNAGLPLEETLQPGLPIGRPTVSFNHESYTNTFL